MIRLLREHRNKASALHVCVWELGSCFLVSAHNFPRLSTRPISIDENRMAFQKQQQKSPVPLGSSFFTGAPTGMGALVRSLLRYEHRETRALRYAMFIKS